MKKFITIILSITFLTLATLPCFAAKDPNLDGWQRYKIKELGMSLLLPPNTQIYTREMADTEKYPDTPKEVVDYFNESANSYLQTINDDYSLWVFINVINKNLPYENLDDKLMEQAYLAAADDLEPKSSHSYIYTPYAKFVQSDKMIAKRERYNAVVSYYTTIMNHNIVGVAIYNVGITEIDEVPPTEMYVLNNIKFYKPLKTEYIFAIAIIIGILGVLLKWYLQKHKE